MESIEYIQYELFLKSVPFVALISVSMIVFIWRNIHLNVQIKTLFYFLAGSTGFLISNTFEQLALSEFWTQFFAAINYPFLVSVPPLWLIFTVNYAGRKFPSKKWQLVPLFANSLISFILALTNDSHNLIWKSIEYREIGDILAMRVEHGLWFWVTAFQSYTFTVIGSAFFFSEFVKSHKIYRKQNAWMLTGILITLFTNIIYIFKIFPFLVKDFTPIAFCLTGICFTIASFKYRFLELFPASRTVLIDLLDDGIVVFDQKKRIIDINTAALRIFGCGKEIIGSDAERLNSFWGDFALVDFPSIDNTEINLSKPAAGMTRYFSVKKNYLYTGGEKTGSVCTITDITKQTLLYEQVKNLAETDSLTGLCNHRYFFIRGNIELQRVCRYGKTLALSIFDIDNFKRINDTYGHLTGDMVLKTVAEIVSSCLRECDIFARFGGDEFVIMMPETDINKAGIVCQRVVEKVFSHEFAFNGIYLRASISMGLTGIENQDFKEPVTLEKLINEADRALYKSKEGGRNCLTIGQAISS